VIDFLIRMALWVDPDTGDASDNLRVKTGQYVNYQAVLMIQKVEAGLGSTFRPPGASVQRGARGRLHTLSKTAHLPGLGGGHPPSA
jgi:hypothetical protein